MHPGGNLDEFAKRRTQKSVRIKRISYKRAYDRCCDQLQRFKKSFKKLLDSFKASC